MDMKKSLLVLGLVAAFAATSAEDGKKCLAFGWEFRHRMTVRDLISAVPLFEQTPLDGVEIHLRMKNSAGEDFGSQNFMEGPLWTETDTSATLAELRELAKYRPFRSSFINTLRAPLTRIAWTDDAAWDRIAENMRVAAKLAKSARLPGLAIDPEDYSKCRQFFRQPGDPAWPELCKLVRARGKQAVAKAFAEYPDLTLFFYWFMSFQEKYNGLADMSAAARDTGDLWPAFINGIMDALPPSARIVDGDENAYNYDFERDDFAKASIRWRENMFALIAPENRQKYRRQVETAFGQYLDMYVNDSSSRYYHPPMDGSRVKRLAANYAAARNAAREYVWFWGERYTWINWPGSVKLGKNCRRETWDQQLVGLSEAMGAVANPRTYFQTQLKRNGASLIKLKAGLPENFSTWRVENGQQGVFSQVDGELRLQGMSRGSYSLAVGHVVSGAVYGVRCEAKGLGASFRIRWKRADGSWCPETSLGAFDGAEVDTWRLGMAVARAPRLAATMVILLNAEGQAPDEIAAFRKVEARQLRDFGEAEITDWRDRLVGVKSSKDGTVQPVWFYAPETARTNAVPLIVGLHTWGGTYHQLSHYRTVMNYARERGWAMVGPNFRGPNFTPQGCGSELAVQDIVDAIEYAKATVKIDTDRIYIIGGSGGGHMTLLMAGRHPEIFAGAAAFCPISDIARWWEERRAPDDQWHNYAANVEAACGGTPSEKPDEYALRSPVTHLKAARAAGVPVYIVTGIHDGHIGSVPCGHSFRAFNELAKPEDRVSETDIATIERTEQVPSALAFSDPPDPFYPERMRIHFRRTSDNVRFTLFEGGHGGNFQAGLDFLSRQRKGRPADWTLPATARAREEALGK